MLHHYKEISRTPVAASDRAAGCAPGRELLALLHDVNCWLESAPLVYGSAQASTLYMLYQNVTFPVDEFCEMFGVSMAAIGRTWPLCAYGTVHERETICLSAQWDGDRAALVRQSISGKPAEIVQSLCFVLECGDDAAAARLEELLHAMQWPLNIAAMHGRHAAFLQQQDLLLSQNPGGLFCYAGLAPSFSAGDCLCALGFAHKTALWTAFLKDGFEPIEFAWLCDQITENGLLNRIDWELALMETLRQLHFQIVNREKQFELFDDAGNRRYFGADGRHHAERALMKILFPLNY